MMELFRIVVAGWLGVRLWRAHRGIWLRLLAPLAVWAFLPVALHELLAVCTAALPAHLNAGGYLTVGGFVAVFALAVVSYVKFAAQRDRLERHFDIEPPTRKRRIGANDEF